MMTDGRGAPETVEDGEPASHDSGRRFPGLPRAAYVLSSLLAVVTALTCAATVLVPDILRGPAVMNGSARGTALIALVCAVPTLVAAMSLARRGHPEQAARWLNTMCTVVTKGACAAVKASWAYQASNDPRLAAVPWPR
jgi:hypothetical protein